MRLRRHPGRVAHHQAGHRTGRKQVGRLQRDLAIELQPAQVVGRAGQRAGVEVGGGDARQSAACQQRGQHTGAGADIDGAGLRRGGRQRCLGHQRQVLATHRREHAVVRVDAVRQRRHFHPLAAPLVGADEALQLAQRGDVRTVGRPVRLQAGGAHIGRPAQRHAMVGVEGQQQQAQHLGPAGLGGALGLEGRGHAGFGRGGGCRGGRARPRGLGQLALQPTPQRLQQLAAVVVIAQPQDAAAFEHMAEGRGGAQRVIGQHHLGRRWVAGQRTPARGLRLALGIGPVDQRG